MNRSTFRLECIIAGVASLVTFIVLHLFILPLLSTRYLGGSFGDGGLYVWLAQSFHFSPAEALAMETRGMYPYPLSRAWSDSFLLPSFLVSALATLGLSFPAAYNTIMLGTCALNGWATALLARTIGSAPLYSLVAGIVMANSSYLVGTIGHPQLFFFFWIPLAWSLILPSTRSERTSSRSWLWAGLCVSGAFYTTVYYAIFISIGLATVWIRQFLLGEVSQRRALRTLSLATLGALPTAYVLPSYLAVQSYFGTRGLHEAEAFAASGASYLAFSPLNSLFGATSAWSHSEAWLCPGYGILVIAVVYGLYCLRTHSRIIAGLFLFATVVALIFSSVVTQGSISELIICVSTWLALLLGLILFGRSSSGASQLTLIVIIFFVLAFGPGGNPAKDEPSFAPFGALYSVMPGLGSIRAVGRFGGVVIMGLIILATRAMQSVFPGRAIARGFVSSILIGICVAENVVSTIPIDVIPTRPMAFARLAGEISPDEAAVVLPFAGALRDNSTRRWSDQAILHSQYMQWAAPLGLRLVNGYSGQRSKLQIDLPSALADFPSIASFDYLARICGVRWVIIVPDLEPSWNRDTFMERLHDSTDFIASFSESPDRSILIELQPLPLNAPDGLLPIFAPVKKNLSLSVEPPIAGSCSIRVSTLGRSSSGATIPLSEEIFTAGSPSPLHPRPVVNPAAGSPIILSVAARECSARISCSIP